ncbi:hypothetical protein CANCADRAFT_3877 [Tortispora caseinolytica NRRL Y-17796]|uniref:FAD dependent oxidoreductase domain-containing protein n=1 Tax=Tortispora caseinolytica NRRL Y-17796 TaxID=767744 RepID=A0A1E4TBY6_9ASCO|nr:hypothetical protein CANCADRAFT_3877 [Tortispora caseinolytica NRRL Y-17796]
MTRIVIVGAGVIGLTVAFKLCHLGYEIIILSRDLPADELRPRYTSQWAGAHVRPAPVDADKEEEFQTFIEKSYKEFQRLTMVPGSSVIKVEGVEYLEFDDPKYRNPKGFYSRLPNFRHISKSDLPPSVVIGTAYDTYCLTPGVYLNYLVDRIPGTRLIRSTLKSIFDAYHYGDIVINCTGNGLLDGRLDEKWFPIRGHTLLLNPQKTPMQTITYQLKDGRWAFIIPRQNGTMILGGTKSPYNYSTEMDDKETEWLLETARKYFIEYTGPEPEIIRHNIGLRLAREGGPRVEAEVTPKGTLIHCYGFAGSGFEMSWGAADKVADLLKSATSKL